MRKRIGKRKSEDDKHHCKIVDEKILLKCESFNCLVEITL